MAKGKFSVLKGLNRPDKRLVRGLDKKSEGTAFSKVKKDRVYKKQSADFKKYCYA